MSDIRQQVADAVRELRSVRGLSQKDAALMLNWTQPALSRVESGDYNPSIRILEHIARSMNARVQVRFTPLTDRSEADAS